MSVCTSVVRNYLVSEWVWEKSELSVQHTSRPSVSTGAFHVRCCALSAHAFLSLRDRWQRLQDTKLAAKLLFFPRQSISPLPVDQGTLAPSPPKPIRQLVVWPTACFLLFPWVVNSVVFIVAVSPGEFSRQLFVCLLVCFFFFFFLSPPPCSHSVLLSLGSLSGSRPRLFPGKKN